MNEHQKVFYFNRGKTSIHIIVQVQVHQNHYSPVLSGLFVGQNGEFGIMIGQIACQSNSLRRVNCEFIPHSSESNIFFSFRNGLSNLQLQVYILQF